jgi:aryl-alcohol dehydrogenase-like predicted oxidoreductase
MTKEGSGAMETRTLGRSGLRVSLAGLGCNQFGNRLDLEATRAVVHRALDLGVTLFDTANSYGEGASETQLGEVLKGVRRDVVVATKFGWPLGGKEQGASRRQIMRAVEDSLRRLQTDWIDLYQLHKPDPTTPIEETLSALQALVAQGKVRYVGCSRLAGWQVVEAAWVARGMGFQGFVSVQDEYNMLTRGIEAELLPAARAYGCGLLPYYPLAGGFLTGKYRRDAPSPDGARLTGKHPLSARFLNAAGWDRLGRLDEVAQRCGRSLTELAFGWLASQRPVASVIAGVTSAEQVEANVAALARPLTAEELAALETALAG